MPRVVPCHLYKQIYFSQKYYVLLNFFKMHSPRDKESKRAGERKSLCGQTPQMLILQNRSCLW